MAKEKLPEIIYTPGNWLKLEQKANLGDNLYAVCFTEEFWGIVSVNSRRNVYLYHHPNKIAYSLTNNTCGRGASEEVTFGSSYSTRNIGEFLLLPSKFNPNTYKGIELAGYDSNHPIIERLISMREEDLHIKRSLVKALKNRKSLSWAKGEVFEMARPLGYLSNDPLGEIKKEVNGLLKKLDISKNKFKKDFLVPYSFHIQN